MLGTLALIATLSLVITAAPNGWLFVGGVIVGSAAASTIPSSACRTDAAHRPCENRRPFTWTKTADEILKSLADYPTKVAPPATENQRET
ncbi:hypothetical protein CP973_14405 [Streptomyces albofaciens JCM 4342]|nr:hypothetical protein CP973_14405 [Streptomyces albofaciens JCM 4342]